MVLNRQRDCCDAGLSECLYAVFYVEGMIDILCSGPVTLTRLTVLNVSFRPCVGIFRSSDSIQFCQSASVVVLYWYVLKFGVFDVSLMCALSA